MAHRDEADVEHIGLRYPRAVQAVGLQAQAAGNLGMAGLLLALTLSHSVLCSLAVDVRRSEPPWRISP